MLEMHSLGETCWSNDELPEITNQGATDIVSNDQHIPSNK